MARRTGHPVFEVDGLMVADTTATLTGDESGSTPGVALPVSGGSGVGATLVPVILSSGESNSGGRGSNADLSSAEKLPRPAVQILNNYTFEFEDLHIGVNNTLDHQDIPDGSGLHGWEAGLADSVESGLWQSDQVYLIKAGQGSSTIANWNVAGVYYGKLVARVEAAKVHFEAEGLTPVWYVWWSQGINDSLVGTTAAVWKAKTIDLWGRFRSLLGFAPIAVTEIFSEYGPYNTAISELAQREIGVSVIESSDLVKASGDAYHWNSASLKTLGQRAGMIDRAFGELEGYALGQSKALFARVTPAPPEVPGTPLDWANTLHASDVGDELVSDGTAYGGAVSVQTINATLPFDLVYDYVNGTTDDGNVLYLASGAANPGGYSWGPTMTDYLFGFYSYSGTMYIETVPGSTTTAWKTGLPAVFKMRLRKFGDDVLCQYSVDGVSWETIRTVTGVLAGRTTIYPKALFVVAGAKRARASLVQ